MSLHIEVVLDPPPPYIYLFILYYLTHRTMNNQFNNIIDNISIMYKISLTLLQALK